MPEPQQVQKPLIFTVSDSIHTAHCTYLVAQVVPGRFILSFFEALPPLVIGTPEEQKRQWDTISAVQATCVARLVVAESDIGGFIQVLQQQQQVMKQQGLQGFKAFA